MKPLIVALALIIAPFAAQAGEAVTCDVKGEAFEGYRSAAKGGSASRAHRWARSIRLQALIAAREQGQVPGTLEASERPYPRLRVDAP
jgi:hypothetical protein